MKIDNYLELMDELLQDAWGLPLSRGKGVVDVQKIRELMLGIREVLPGELSQAKAIVADRTQILSEAKKKAESIVGAAEEKAKHLTSESELVVQSRLKSEQVLQESRAKAREMRTNASDFVDGLMKRTDELLTGSLSEFRKARSELKSVERQGL